LIISHDGPEKEHLMHWAQKLGISDAVEFIGFISEKEQEELYQKAMFYFSILTSDALSVSLLEAMAHGCIPIVSDLPDNRDWVEDKKNGVILASDTVYETLSKLAEDQKSIFKHNRNLIAEKAHFPSAIAAYCASLDKIQ
jgi:glycosyltransferase involved in cell wall biosynthesis